MSHPYQDHSVDELAYQLEPDSDPESVKDIVRATITHIRKALRNATGDHEADRYRLNLNNIDVDLWRMHAHIATANRANDDDDTALKALEQAVACYRGDFATGHHHLWIDAKRTTYRNQVTDALSRIAAIHEADKPETALAALEQAYQIEEPYGINEPTMKRIMLIQGRLNRPDSVKRTMQLLRDRLRADAGRIPDDATERAYKRMISKEPRCWF